MNTKIDQKRFFQGLDFEEKQINGSGCYLGPDGCFYRMDHFGSTYVIEYAEDQQSADLNMFEDADRFDDDLAEDELIGRVQSALRQYVTEAE